MPNTPLSESPTWWKEAVFYQIYPRSFVDSNGDGYDISDYTSIGPEYGSLDDFLALTSALRERSLRLILDQVLNHTSDEHAWFQESRSSRDNPKRDWYHWVEPKGFDSEGNPLPPNNWKSVFDGSVWEWDDGTGQFYLHCFSRKQPDLNWKNPSVRHALYDVLQTWIARGTDGFRLDVINMVAKSEDYPDIPQPEGITAQLLNLDQHGVNQPPLHDYLREMNLEVFENRDLYSVGETWWVDSTNTLDFTAYDRRELNGCFYFYFHGCKTGREHFDEFWKLYQATRGRSWLTITLGNHDSRRILSKFGDPANHHHASATLLATWLLTLPATPFLFQGDELGLVDMTYDRIEDYSDIQTRNRYRSLLAAGKTPTEALTAVQADSRDNSRTPMPWNSSLPNAGFSTGTPWLPIPSMHRPLHAEAAIADPHSIFHSYAELLALRKSVKSLVYGDLTSLTQTGDVIAYRRSAWEGHPAVTVVLNWSGESQAWPVAGPKGSPLFANYGTIDSALLRPWEAVIFPDQEAPKY